MSLAQFLYVLAAVLFFLAGFGVPMGRHSVGWYGLFLLCVIGVFGSGFSFGN